MSLANFLARYSVTRYNKFRPARVLCRKGYQFLSALYCHFSPHHQRSLIAMEYGELVDTYPWPYSDASFANWEESTETDDYSLVPDRSGFVIRHSTSYCAYKIYEVTGKWPKRKSKNRVFNAKDWRQFLSEVGYYEVDKNPSSNFYYVGVNPGIGEFGEVVWFERQVSPKLGRSIVTTYRAGHWFTGIVSDEDYVWVKITRHDYAKVVKHLLSHPEYA